MKQIYRLILENFLDKQLVDISVHETFENNNNHMSKNVSFRTKLFSYEFLAAAIIPFVCFGLNLHYSLCRGL